MRLLARLRRWSRDLRALWAANLRVADEWRRDRNRLLRYRPPGTMDRPPNVADGGRLRPAPGA